MYFDVQGGHPRIPRARGKFQLAHAWSTDLDQHLVGKLRGRRVQLSSPNFDLDRQFRAK